MPDVTINNEALDTGGPDIPIFNPISLTASVSVVADGTTVNFAFAASSLPPNATFDIGFYYVQSSPATLADAAPVKPQKLLGMTPITVSPPPPITSTPNGGEFSFTFTSSTLPASAALVVVTVGITGQTSLGMSSLSYG